MSVSIERFAAQNAIGPYSEAVLAGDFLFVAGQVGIDRSIGKFPEQFGDEVRQMLSNLDSVLTRHGFGIDNVVKVLVIITDADNVKEFNEIYGEFFAGRLPARTLTVSGLVKEARVEVDVIAARNQ